MKSADLKPILENLGVEWPKCAAYCGQGWVGIITKLTEDLIAMGWDRELLQIKEKFGSMRYYIDAGTPEMYSRIRQAEEQTAKTCENCGNPGKIGLHGGHWYKCLCQDCGGKWESDES
jgi:hypothetical protein